MSPHKVVEFLLERVERFRTDEHRERRRRPRGGDRPLFVVVGSGLDAADVVQTQRRVRVIVLQWRGFRV